MQLSTAISDGVLAAVAFWSAWSVYVTAQRPGATGLALIGLAAFAGMLRFSVFPGILAVHSFCSGLAGLVGIPLLALSFGAAVFRFPQAAQLPLAGAVLVVLFLIQRYVLPIPQYGTILGALAALLIIVAGVKSLPAAPGVMAIAGAAVLIVAGIGVGSKGTLLGFQRVDIYHYLLAISVWLMGSALARLGR